MTKQRGIVMKGTRFIAETGPSGEVTWVWRFGPEDRVARPVLDASACRGELASAEFCGAPADTVKGWIMGRTDSKSPGSLEDVVSRPQRPASREKPLLVAVSGHHAGRNAASPDR